jgi:hypothetical protein
MHSAQGPVPGGATSTSMPTFAWTRTNARSHPKRSMRRHDERPRSRRQRKRGYWSPGAATRLHLAAYQSGPVRAAASPRAYGASSGNDDQIPRGDLRQFDPRFGGACQGSAQGGRPPGTTEDRATEHPLILSAGDARKHAFQRILPSPRVASFPTNANRCRLTPSVPPQSRTIRRFVC